jgi:hypothetical protein
VVVADAYVAAARRFMRCLKPANKSRVHMQDEGPAVRNKILKEFCDAPPITQAHIYIASVTRTAPSSVGTVI